MRSAKAYLVTGDDYLDDPAWGVTPIVEGSVGEVLAWLRAQEAIDQYAVSIDGAATVWATELLRAPH